MATASLNPPADDREALRREMAVMGEAAYAMVADAMSALLAGDTERAHSVIERDQAVDEWDHVIERRALAMIAAHVVSSSSEGEVRFFGTALKVLTDLERVGDHAVNIAKTALRMPAGELSPARFGIDLKTMGEVALVILRETIITLRTGDLDHARAVQVRDGELDALYKSAQRELRSRLRATAAEEVAVVSHLLFVTHYLERIGDHCVGIAERLEAMDAGNSQRILLPRADALASAFHG